LNNFLSKNSVLSHNSKNSNVYFWIVLNCFGSPVLKRQLVVLSKTLQLVRDQDLAPYLAIFFSLQKAIDGIVEQTRFIQISTILKLKFEF